MKSTITASLQGINIHNNRQCLHTYDKVHCNMDTVDGGIVRVRANGPCFAYRFAG